MKSLSPVQLFVTPWTTRLLRPWDSPGRNTGVGCHFLLQEIFPTQKLNKGLLHCRQILYQVSHQRSPLGLERKDGYEGNFRRGEGETGESSTWVAPVQKCAENQKINMGPGMGCRPNSAGQSPGNPCKVNVSCYGGSCHGVVSS